MPWDFVGFRRLFWMTSSGEQMVQNEIIDSETNPDEYTEVNIWCLTADGLND